MGTLIYAQMKKAYKEPGALGVDLRFLYQRDSELLSLTWRLTPLTSISFHSVLFLSLVRKLEIQIVRFYLS